MTALAIHDVLALLAVVGAMYLLVKASLWLQDRRRP